MSDPAKPPLQLQPGRYYRADNTGIYGPLFQIGIDHLFSVEFAAYTWKQDGSPALPGGPRLLEEVPAPFSLEEGGYYIDENEVTHGPLLKTGPDAFGCSGKYWYPNGWFRAGTDAKLIRKVEIPLISSKEAEEVLRSNTPSELDHTFNTYVASLNGAASKPTPSNPDRDLLLAILIRSKERLAFFRKEADDETWRFHEQAQGKCDELDGIVYEIENHLNKRK